MSDYCCVWPLWRTDGPMDSRSLGLSGELDRDLRAWQEHFERLFRHDTGWSSPAAARAYEQSGRALLRRLSTELPDHYIELDLWPVDGGFVPGWEEAPGVPGPRTKNSTEPST